MYQLLYYINDMEIYSGWYQFEIAFVLFSGDLARTTIMIFLIEKKKINKKKKKIHKYGKEKP